jgi:hypothetical protein
MDGAHPPTASFNPFREEHRRVRTPKGRHQFVGCPVREPELAENKIKVPFTEYLQGLAAGTGKGNVAPSSLQMILKFAGSSSSAAYQKNGHRRGIHKPPFDDVLASLPESALSPE